MARKTKPKYSVGTKVYHTSTGKWGIVDEVFESQSITREGVHTFYEWRYYVWHSGSNWSVPERCLVS